jgi:hypothetical protein
MIEMRNYKFLIPKLPWMRSISRRGRRWDNDDSSVLHYLYAESRAVRSVYIGYRKTEACREQPQGQFTKQHGGETAVSAVYNKEKRKDSKEQEKQYK